MEDLYDFVLEVKELDLYGKSRAECCGDSLIEGNCECTNPQSAEIDRAEQCMFGQCMSWEDWQVVRDWIDAQYAAGFDKISFDMIPTLFAALGYQGLNGNGSTVPEFYNNVAEVGAIIAGSAAAVYAGLDVMRVAVHAESQKETAVSIAAVFNNNGGISIVQILMFLIESFWSVATLTQVAEIGLAPFVLAYLMQAEYAGATSIVGDEMATQYLMWSFLIAFGSFIGAWAIRQSCDVMVGYYDITDSKAFQDYLTEKGADFDINMKRGMFIADLLHHSAMLATYGALAFGVQAAAVGYVYLSVTGQSVDTEIFAL